MIRGNPDVKKLLTREVDPAFARRAQLILENLDFKPGMRILDVGCGRGFYIGAIWLLYDDLRITGVDLNGEYLNQAKQTFKNLRHVHKNFKNSPQFKRADARKLPFADQTFDRVICSEVFEHIKEDRQVIKEIYRVLKTGGKAIFTVPSHHYPFLWDPLNWVLERFFQRHVPSHIWWLAGIWADHVRLYSDNELKDKLERCGFKIEGIWHSTHYCFPFAHFLLYGIGKNLVEQGLVGESLNRFAVDTDPSLLTRIVQAPFSFFDRLNQDDMPGKSVVNFVVEIRK